MTKEEEYALLELENAKKKDGSGRSGTKTFNGSFQTARATKEGRSKN
jgi:hypothetical protein